MKVLSGSSQTAAEKSREIPVLQRQTEWTQADKKELRTPASSQHIAVLREGLQLIQSISPSAAGVAARHLFMTPIRRVSQASHWKQTQPPCLFSVNAGDTRVQGYSWGKAPWILLAHGWDSNAASMSRFVDPIQKKGFGVLAFDGPAHGASGGELTTMGGFALASDAIYREFGDLHAVVGHSIGSPAAVMALEKHPSIRPRLAFVSAPSRCDAAVTYFSKVFGLSEETDANLRRLLSDEVGRPIENITFKHLREQCSEEVLIVHDAQDLMFGIEEARATLRMLPHARLLETKGLGHAKILTDDGVIAAIVKFVTSARSKM